MQPALFKWDLCSVEGKVTERSQIMVFSSGKMKGRCFLKDLKDYVSGFAVPKLSRLFSNSHYAHFFTRFLGPPTRHSRYLCSLHHYQLPLPHVPMYTRPKSCHSISRRIETVYRMHCIVTGENTKNKCFS